MISDALFEAHSQIAEYMKDPTLYGDDPQFSADVWWLLERMDELRAFLDASPSSPALHPRFKEKYQARWEPSEDN